MKYEERKDKEMLTVPVRLVFVSQRVPPATLYTHSVNECANKRKESKRASNKGKGKKRKKGRDGMDVKKTTAMWSVLALATIPPVDKGHSADARAGMPQFVVCSAAQAPRPLGPSGQHAVKPPD